MYRQQFVSKGSFYMKKKHRRFKERKWEIVLMTPSIIGVGLFFILPFCVVIYYSMVDNPLNPSFVFLDNYSRLFQNSAFLQAAKNTAVFSAIAVPLSVVLSLGMALILEQNIPLRSTFRTFFLTPLMVPTASIVLIWQVFFHYNGTINEFLLHIGAGKIDWFKSAYSQIVILILFLWKNLGYNMVLFMAGLGQIPRDYMEVAELDGATGWQKFIYIKIRYLSPTILFVAIMSLINSFKVFREVYLLTGDYPYDTLYLLQHFMNNTFRALDYQKLSAAAIIMCLVMVVIIGILFLIENHFGKDVEG